MLNDLNSEDTLEYYYKAQKTNLSLLYPDLQENYFKDNTENDIFLKPKNAINKYDDLKIKPYISNNDLNGYTYNQSDEIKSHSAWEIGIKISF